MVLRSSVLALLIILVFIPSGYGFSLQSLPFVGRWFGPRFEDDRPNEVVIPIAKKSNYYAGSIYIGESKDPYHVIFGASFSGIWLFSKTACESSEFKKSCRKIHLYDDSEIKNVNEKKVFTLTHSMGTVGGYIVKDKLRIGRKTLENQDIGIVTKWDKKIVIEEFDGYFGIQFSNPKLLVSIGDPFFHRFYDAGIIKEMVYGVYINLPRAEGQVLLGGTNPTFIEKEAPFVEIPTISDAAGWFVDVKSVGIGANEMGSNLKTLIDPSDFNIGGKKEVIDKIHAEINAVESKDFPGLFLIDCEQVENKQLPTITIDFNGKKFDMDGFDYIWRNCIPIFCRCYSYFSPRDLKGYDLILGAPFLNRYYSKYDVAKKSISFAPANHDRNNN